MLVSGTAIARRLRRVQTKEEKQLWQALRAGRFAGFKFRRQHPIGGRFLDFYCPMGRLSVELDGAGHGYPGRASLDLERERFLQTLGIEELRFWNHRWKQNREGVLLEIWHALQRRSGCTQVMRKLENLRYIPPPLHILSKKPPLKPTEITKSGHGRGT